MRKAQFMLIFFTALVFSLSAQAFYHNMPESQRRELARAYYMVGMQYETIGEQEKGQEFIDLAFDMYPALNPNLEVESTEPKTEPPQEEQTRRQPVVQPEYQAPPRNVVRYQFTKLIRAFFQEDVQEMLEVMDSTVSLPGIEALLSRQNIRNELTSIFAAAEIDSTPITRVYNLRSMEFSEVEGREGIWRASIQTQPDPAMDLSSFIYTVNRTQNFYFHRVGSEWLLFAIGTLPRVIAAPVQPESIVDETFREFVGNFLAEDFEAALSIFDRRVFLLELGVQVDEEELLETFHGYAEDYDFAGLDTFDIYTNSVITVLAGEDYFQDSAVYALTPEYSQRAQEELPFFSGFSTYYFTFYESEHTWKIFAIF
ncbi:MAG: hypothetical protein ACLFR1_12805 [Spirochaetia bacterium]